MHEKCNLQPKVRTKFGQSYTAFYECLDCEVEVCRCGQTYGKHYGTESKALKTITENRSDESVERAKEVMRLKEKGLSVPDIAREKGVSRSYIYQILRKYA